MAVLARDFGPGSQACDVPYVAQATNRCPLSWPLIRETWPPRWPCRSRHLRPAAPDEADPAPNRLKPIDLGLILPGARLIYIPESIYRHVHLSANLETLTLLSVDELAVCGRRRGYRVPSSDGTSSSRMTLPGRRLFYRYARNKIIEVARWHGDSTV